ncbi:3-oxoacyl-[acyl-carrier-protein] synthase III C-terminal domain-containing protein [Thalassotalea psychrophila]|uniref:3-oxoacyl-[acyl-carrier-protein] synthase III C-terminal domain-containing protein n=1 Tax=Thalassotalea psychrophila TaxID=3065647 RepID=A0ABY9TX85_9GAMM|nr:3-oxoacyl-[acyl-carrier-protein] synthase III C-terminal domain-containing protein [Colwelliaceae bacterium SQ149]
MSDSYLQQLGYSLGSERRSIEQAEQAGVLLSTIQALKESGFEQHFICAESETAYQLACNALVDSQIDTAEIDCIIYANCLPLNANHHQNDAFESSRDVKDLMVFPASKLQVEFGMENAFVIGLTQQACTCMLGSIRIANNFITAEENINNILCISADNFPENAYYEQAYNLISDGGAACLVSRKPQGFLILTVKHITNGAQVLASDDETVGSYFSYLHQLISETLLQINKTVADIDWVVPQNTNAKAWSILASLLGIDEQKAWFESLAEVGHVISSDNIINLARLDHSGKINKGDLVLVFMAGFGSNWQCMVVEKV